MLKGIDPILTPELLKVLAEMGHDDAIAVVDANFTAASLGTGKSIIHLPGVGVVRAVQAIISLLPIEAEVRHPVAFMQIESHHFREAERKLKLSDPTNTLVTERNFQSKVQREVIGLLRPLMQPTQTVEAVERFAFYERVRRSYAICITSELQGYSNFLLRKGVICEALQTGFFEEL